MSPALEAHLRMLSVLPVRTHEMNEVRVYEKAANSPRAVSFRGREYRSVCEAMRREKINSKQFYRLMRDGVVKYIEEEDAPSRED